MENATKALLMAAGVLIGVMILSLGVALYSELDAYVESSHERMRFNEQNAFNTQFTKYINYNGTERQFDLTIQDVVTAANVAYENNVKYDATVADESTLYVSVYLNGTSIENNIHQISTELLTNNIEKRYICNENDVRYSQLTGRIFEIYFAEE